MRAILRFLGSRWFLTFLGVVLLGLLVWWFGPWFALLEGVIARVAIIVVMLLIWAGANLLLYRRRKRIQRSTRPAGTRFFRCCAAPGRASR